MFRLTFVSCDNVVRRIFTLTKGKIYKYEFMPANGLIVLHVPADSYLNSCGANLDTVF